MPSLAAKLRYRWSFSKLRLRQIGDCATDQMIRAMRDLRDPAKDVELTPPAEIVKECIVCMTPRVGSTTLCHALHETHRLGYADEYYTPENLPAVYCQVQSGDVADIASYAGAIRKKFVSINGVFSVKTDWKRFAPFKEEITSKKDSTYFIYLTRQNLLAQALSLEVAKKTNFWHLPAGRVNKINEQEICEWLKSSQGMRKIELALDFIRKQQINWELFFQANEIKPLRLSYEQAMGDLNGTVSRIADYIGEEIAAPAITPQFSRLSSGHRKTFVEWYLSGHQIAPPAWV